MTEKRPAFEQLVARVPPLPTTGLASAEAVPVDGLRDGVRTVIRRLEAHMRSVEPELQAVRLLAYQASEDLRVALGETQGEDPPDSEKGQ